MKMKYLILMKRDNHWTVADLQEFHNYSAAYAQMTTFRARVDSSIYAIVAIDGLWTCNVPTVAPTWTVEELE